MTRHRIVAAFAATLLVLSTHPLSADVRADQKTRTEFGGMLGRMVNFFGGKAAKEGVVSTVAVKGDRAFNDCPLVRISRLSVMPVTDAEWNRIEALSLKPICSP